MKKTNIAFISNSLESQGLLSKCVDSDSGIKSIPNGPNTFKSLLEIHDIELVIIDHGTDQGEILSLVKQIRFCEDFFINSLPVLLICEEIDQSFAELANAAGVSDFLLTPIKPHETRFRIANCLELSRTRIELDATRDSLNEYTAIDPLTNLTSKPYFKFRLEQDFAFVRRHGTELSVIHLVIDNFDEYALEHGSSFADDILLWTSSILDGSTRKEDTVSRFTHGQFAILAPATTKEHATSLCERICKEISSNPLHVGNVTFPITLSIGIVGILEDEMESPDQCLIETQKRVGLAQWSGGNQIVTGLPSQMQNNSRPVSSIDKALELLRLGQQQTVDAHIATLTEKLLPLLVSISQEYNIDLSIDDIKHKLANGKKM